MKYIMNDKKYLIAFVSGTYLLTIMFLISKSQMVNTLAQATPAFVAFLLILITKHKKKEIANLGLFRFGDIKWYIIAIFLPFAAIICSYCLGAVFGFFSVHFQLDWISFIYHFLLYTFMWPLIWAVGEEIGWRGFLQPKLTEKFGLRQGILITGIIWAVWHYIFIFLDGYYTSGNIIIDIVLFTITVIFMSFSIGWIRWASKSVWPCAIFHSASNAAWQLVAYQFHSISSNSIYISGEAGVVNILFWGVCLIVVVKQLNQNNSYTLIDTVLMDNRKY